MPSDDEKWINSNGFKVRVVEVSSNESRRWVEMEGMHEGVIYGATFCRSIVPPYDIRVSRKRSSKHDMSRISIIIPSPIFNAMRHIARGILSKNKSIKM